MEEEQNSERKKRIKIILDMFNYVEDLLCEEDIEHDYIEFDTIRHFLGRKLEEK